MRRYFASLILLLLTALGLSGATTKEENQLRFPDGTVQTTAAGGITSSTVITNFALNTVRTNNSGSIQIVSGLGYYSTAAVTGDASLALMADQSGGNTFTQIGGIGTSTLLTGLAISATNYFGGFLSNNATWYLTNNSTGAGNSSGIIYGQLTTMGTPVGIGLSKASLFASQLVGTDANTNLVSTMDGGAVTAAPGITNVWTWQQGGLQVSVAANTTNFVVFAGVGMVQATAGGETNMTYRLSSDIAVRRISLHMDANSVANPASNICFGFTSNAATYTALTLSNGTPSVVDNSGNIWIFKSNDIWGVYLWSPYATGTRKWGWMAEIAILSP